MTERSTAGRSAALGAALLLTGALAGGCAERSASTYQTDAADSKARYGYATGYPFRPAPLYKLEDLDELSGPEGYTAGY